VLVDGAGHPTLIDTRWAVLSADDRLLAIDVATMAASLALLVGAPRAVAAAAEVLPSEVLAEALPLVQPLVLPPPLRRRVRRTELLGEVRDELQRAAGVEEYRVADVARISLGRIVGLVGTAVLVYVALAFASNWSAIADALGDADWSYVPAVLVLAFLGFPGGALSLMGAVPNRLPFLQTTQIMFAQSFLNRFTPANAGGMALRARYLQANGAELSVAAASVGITSLASGVLQAVLLVVFAVWAGDEDVLRFDLPDVSTIAVAILVVLVVAGAVMATPWGRRTIFGPLSTTVSKIWRELSGVAAEPAKLALLFGGAFVGKITTILAFTESARAFGVDLAFPHLALLYMTANTVASAAPTPGGLGAIEAALVAVLTGAGVDPATALSITLVFRLATYWLPVPPGYVALADVRRRELV
jgi:undecaprenyl-diphosphatase